MQVCFYVSKENENFIGEVREMAEKSNKSLSQVILEGLQLWYKARENMKREIESIFEDWSIVEDELNELEKQGIDPDMVVAVEDVYWDDRLNILAITFVPVPDDIKSMEEIYEKIMDIRAALRYAWAQKFYQKFGNRLDEVIPLLEELWK